MPSGTAKRRAARTHKVEDLWAMLGARIVDMQVFLSMGPTSTPAEKFLSPMSLIATDSP